MRVPGSKKIDGVLKGAYNRTHIGMALHWLRNSDRRNAVFVWIPKNAGTSIYRALRSYGCLMAKDLERIKYRFSQSGLVTFAHMDYSQLVAQNYVSQDFDRGALKFCFCRNPYDRAVSLYSYVTACNNTQVSFLDFWRDIHEGTILPLGLRTEHVLDTSLYNAQVRWIEKLDIDFVGRFESLERDFDRLTAYLDLPNARLGRLNSSNRKAVANYYCRESKRIVEDLYHEDFIRFDYDFETDEALGIETRLRLLG